MADSAAAWAAPDSAAAWAVTDSAAAWAVTGYTTADNSFMQDIIVELATVWCISITRL